jgi:predicted RNA-binding protein Jag
MVRFDFIEDKDSAGYLKELSVKVNNIEDKNAFGFLNKDDEISLYLYSEEICNIIVNEKIGDVLKDKITDITIPMDIIDVPIGIEEKDSASICIEKEDVNYIIYFKFQYDFEFWKKGYSIADITHAIEDVFNNEKEMFFKLDDSDTTVNGFSVYKKINIDKKIIDNINEIMKLVNEKFEVAVKLCEKSDKDTIYFEFEVDKSIQVIYNQYLAYFTQFLEDIGISAKAEIKNEVNKILLNIIPEDKTMALKNIRDCLEIYINLIDNKEIQIYEDYSNVAVMQLKANITHLQSQLMLAHTIIEQQQISINLLKNASVIIPQLPKDEIKIFDGAIKIKEFEYKGLVINPVKILKLLRRKK